MKILVMGAGARESAIGWSLSKSPHVTNLFFSPGNSGTVQYGENLPLDMEHPEELIALAKEKKIDLVVMGRFVYIQAGIGELFREAGVTVFGPTLAAAEIEGSKVFSKKLLNDLNIPTPKAFIAHNLDSAQEFIKSASYPLVMKTDGPMVGIGVEIIYDDEQAHKFLGDCFSKKIFQSMGASVLIEEFLEGVEISAHAFCDGTTAIMMPFAQDHKRLFDGDTGPNTAGIGAVAPVFKSDITLLDEIKNKVMEPILTTLHEQGRPFVGIMYPGIMITKDGWRVLEINARFGDPEAVCYLRLLKTDLYEIISACLSGKLDSFPIEWSENYTCSVVLTTKEYHEKSLQIGQLIYGLPNSTPRDDSTIIFHAETALQDTHPIIAGPRIACISSVAPTLKQAIESSYQEVEEVTYDGKYFRKDIGAKALTL
jgi:phosphoribosylamine--glycine ligase